VTAPGRRALYGAGAVSLATVLWVLVDDRRRAYRRVRTHLARRRPRPTPPGEVRLTVVVPAYREAGRIGATVLRLRHDLDKIDRDGGLEIVVVDDGSGDATASEARAAGADRVVRHGRNRGKGAAVRSGVLASSGRTIAFTDADMAYSPDQLAGLLEEVEAGWDVVAGSRRHTDTTTLVRAGRLREIGGRAINLLTRAVLLGQYRDTQCGLKAFRSDVAQLIFGHTRIDGFAFDVEIFFLVEEYHLSLTEVPVRVENSGRSTVRVVRDASRLVRDLFRIRRWAHRGVYDLDAAELIGLADRAVGSRSGESPGPGTAS
jgi:dolichyl-phosphate beta-glucosyltransferase